MLWLPNPRMAKLLKFTEKKPQNSTNWSRQTEAKGRSVDRDQEKKTQGKDKIDKSQT